MSSMSMPIIGRHARAIRLLTCLQGGTTLNAVELSRRLKVSRRTIYRDVRLIRHAGIAIEFDSESCGYRLEGERQPAVMPAILSEREVAQLALTAHLSPLCAMPQFRIAVRETLGRLLMAFSRDVRDAVADLLNSCEVSLPCPEYPDQVLDRVEVILGAMVRRRQVRLELASQADAPSIPRPVKFAPYYLVAELDDWILLGRCSEDNRLVRVAVSQIVDVCILNEPYRVPANFRARLHRYSDQLPQLA
jgi:predicted DNA-binding transcriptional regulator YafY